VLLLDVLRELGRDTGLGGGHQQAPLDGGIWQQVGDDVAEDARIPEHTCPVAGDGGIERLAGLTMRIELIPDQLWSPFFQNLPLGRA
jgi:hypothetical protein